MHSNALMNNSSTWQKYYCKRKMQQWKIMQNELQIKRTSGNSLQTQLPFFLEMEVLINISRDPKVGFCVCLFFSAHYFIFWIIKCITKYFSKDSHKHGSKGEQGREKGPRKNRSVSKFHSGGGPVVGPQ